MSNELSDLNYLRSEIIKKGYFVIKKFATAEDCILLRQKIGKKIIDNPKYDSRINSDFMPDYSHKRSHDNIDRTTRYYSFYHNFSKWSQIEKKILQKGIDIRNQIEEGWINLNEDYKYHKKILQNYNIFTKYEESTGLLRPHKDFPKKLKYPLLQFNLILSEFGKDYNNGEFIFSDYKENKVKIHNDLECNIGDALLFDKYLTHSVETTEKGKNNIGRWSVLIGARAEKVTYLQEKKIRLKYKLKKFFS